MARIFISYRRSDSELIAGLISQRLRERFGPDSAYLDTDTVPLGVDFRDHINTAVGQCVVLLAVIGDGWIGSVSDLNSDNARDFMRLEIESALERDIPVVPVLVGQATMPAESDLPPSLQSLTFRNAAEVRAGRDLDQHLERLVQGIEIYVLEEEQGDPCPESDDAADQPTELVGGESPQITPGVTPEITPKRMPGRLLLSLLAIVILGVFSMGGLYAGTLIHEVVGGFHPDEWVNWMVKFLTWIIGITLAAYIWKRLRRT